ncbi:MAG: heparinase II/III domain-containing protein [Gaiellaceae bacterium]
MSRPIRRRVFPRGGGAASLRPLEANHELWASPAFARRASEPAGLLAEFAANYGEDVLEAARSGDVGEARRRAEAWIDAEPARVSAAWHPYVVSTRLSAWVAASTLAPGLVTGRVADSAHRQVLHLRRNIEDDILGNHVLRNAKALVLAGTALGEPAAVAQGRALLDRELPEQVLSDGGHYERSPAYHRLVLLDLLEVAPFAPVADVVDRMRSFAAASSRPDGAPALFNDGGLDIAPVLQLPQADEGVDIRGETGYVFVRRGPVWLAFDCGAPSPAFLPAHAHADALSFQLWVDGRPAVVDPGTSTYEPGPVRAFERGTEAHSTVAVGGDQFRLWGSFRSGPLPEVRLLDATADRVAGEARLPSGFVHRRTLRLGDGTLDVEDRVEGRGVVDLVSSIPLAADTRLDVSPRDGESFHEARTVSERFGERASASAVVQRARVSLPWEGAWHLRWQS